MENGLRLSFLRTRIGAAWWVPLLFLLAPVAMANAGDYTYATNSDNTLAITKYTGSGGAVVIPSAIDGRTVTIIGDAAFVGCTNLTNVTIPDSVTSIGKDAFANFFLPPFNGLTSVTIGNGVTNIGSSAFSFCMSLTNVTIGNGVTSIGDAAFWSCDRLTSVMIPNSVTSIGYEAFDECNGLTSVTIPNSVISIGGGAFWNCYSLTSVTIGNGVTSIGYGAFMDCTSLAVIMVDSGNSVYSSMDGVLFDKSQAMLIQYPGGKAGSYTIPNSVTSIERSAFYYCPSLTSVTIPNSVTNIGNYAFEDCTSLMGVYFKGNAPSIEDIFYEDDYATVYYLAGTTGWDTTFGGRPAVLWSHNPTIKANGEAGTITVNYPETVSVTVAMNAANYAGVPVDWWVLARAESSWYYLNNLGQWMQFGGILSHCHPVLQGPLFNLPATQVLNMGLPIGSYTFWFAVDSPMDGILNIGGYILLDSVNVTMR